MRPVLLIVVPLLLAAGGDMNVATFNAKVAALKAKGAGALFSSDLGLLKREFGDAAAAYRRGVAADKAAGRAPHSCPPAKIKLTSGEIMGYFAAIPSAQQRTTSVRQGFAAWMKQRFPCR